MTNKRKFLVVAPHIDDEAIGCGGSILKHVAAGNEVAILYVYSGYGQERQEREAEAEKACKVMGAKNHRFLRLDGESDLNDIEEKVAKYFREVNPDYVYAPHSEEADSDHRFVHKFIMEVVWKANGEYFPHIPGKSNIKGILQYEVHTPIQKPNYFEDISDVVSRKRELINAYATQVRRVNYGEGIIALNRYRGIFREMGDFVEAFNLRAFKNMFD